MISALLELARLLEEPRCRDVKLDGSFVRDLLENPRSESLVRAVTQLATSMASRRWRNTSNRRPSMHG